MPPFLSLVQQVGAQGWCRCSRRARVAGGAVLRRRPLTAPRWRKHWKPTSGSTPSSCWPPCEWRRQLAMAVTFQGYSWRCVLGAMVHQAGTSVAAWDGAPRGNKRSGVRLCYECSGMRRIAASRSGTRRIGANRWPCGFSSATQAPAKCFNRIRQRRSAYAALLVCGWARETPLAHQRFLNNHRYRACPTC